MSEMKSWYDFCAEKADKVRHMTDEELAEIFSKVGGTIEQWLEWLKS